MIPYDTPQAIITTIIPTYRRPKLLGRAIRSVLNQTYPHFKVCVYDNASGDETAEIVSEIAKHDSRVSYFCHKENIGLVNNFIYGMKHVETPFFSFLSDDDVLLPWFFEVVMRGFEKFPQAIFSAGETIPVSSNGKIINTPLSEWAREGYYAPPEGLFSMIGKNCPLWTAILFRKEIIENIGLLDQEIGYPMDLDYELRSAARFPFVIIKRPCAIFSVVADNSSIAHILGDEQFIKYGYLKIIKNLKENEFLPVDVRINATEKLVVWLREIFFWCGVMFIKENKIETAYNVAGALYSGLNSKKYAIALFTLAWFRHYFSLGYYVFVMLNKSRKLFIFNKKNTVASKELQKQYGYYAGFLNM